MILVIHQPDPHKLLKCVQKIQGEAEAAFLWPSLTAADLLALRSAIAALSASDESEWMLKYGCAVLPLPLRPHTSQALLGSSSRSDGSGGSGGSGRPAVPDIRARLPDLSLMLVCLDQWDFEIHRCGKDVTL